MSFFVNFERNNNYKEILQGKYRKLCKMIKLNQNVTSSSISRNLRRRKKVWQVAGQRSCDIFDSQHNEEGVKEDGPLDAPIKMLLYAYI